MGNGIFASVTVVLLTGFGPGAVYWPQEGPPSDGIYMSEWKEWNIWREAK
jgi:hypothetical protein